MLLMYVVYEPSRLKVSLSAIVLGIPMETKNYRRKNRRKTHLYVKQKMDMIMSLCELRIILRRNRRLKIKELETN